MLIHPTLITWTGTTTAGLLINLRHVRLIRTEVQEPPKGGEEPQEPKLEAFVHFADGYSTPVVVGGRHGALLARWIESNPSTDQKKSP